MVYQFITANSNWILKRFYPYYVTGNKYLLTVYNTNKRFKADMMNLFLTLHSD